MVGVRETEDKGLANKEQHHEGIKYPAHVKLYHERRNHEGPNPVRYSYFVWSAYCFPASFAHLPVCGQLSK
jgi:hypothetical protein